MTNKEKYFTGSNFASVTRSILGRISQHTELRPLPRLSEKSALLIIDMQDFFLNEDSHAYIPSAQMIIPPILKTAAAYRNSGNPVIYTRHINTVENSGMMNHWWRDIITLENPLHKISDEFCESSGMIIDKSQYDAFLETGLQELLTGLNVRTVAVTGVMTNLCCESTARSAFARGFEVIVPVDTTAAYNYEFHFSSLLNLSYGFSYVTHSDDLVRSLS